MVPVLNRGSFFIKGKEHSSFFLSLFFNLCFCACIPPRAPPPMFFLLPLALVENNFFCGFSGSGIIIYLHGAAGFFDPFSISCFGRARRNGRARRAVREG